MAKKDNKSAATKESSTPKITRITASDTPVDSKPKKTKTPDVKTKIVATGTPKSKSDKVSPTKEKRRNPFRATADYFAGAWYELKQVRWPNRKATWSLTLAVMAFTAFFAVLVLLLDALFKYLFQLILG